MQHFRTESSERGEKELLSAARLARPTFWIHAAFTGSCLLVYVVGGMSLFDAFARRHHRIDKRLLHIGCLVRQVRQSRSSVRGILFMLSWALPFAGYIRS